MASASAIHAAVPNPYEYSSSSFAGIHRTPTSPLTSPRLPTKQTISPPEHHSNNGQRHRPAPPAPSSQQTPQSREQHRSEFVLLRPVGERDDAVNYDYVHVVPARDQSIALPQRRQQPIDPTPLSATRTAAAAAAAVKQPFRAEGASAFLALPTEVHIELATWLPWQTQWSLKRTCKYFHSLPELAAPVSFFHQRRRGKAYQAGLLRALGSAAVVRRGYEPCYACARFRWKGLFEIAQYQRGFLWCDAADAGGGGWDDVEMRDAYGEPVWSGEAADGSDGSLYENGKFCIECGVAAGKYAAGEMLEVVQDWSDYHGDRHTIVVPASGQLPEPSRTTGVMISEEGQDEMDRKMVECGRFGCNGQGCGGNKRRRS